jgi:hypothetical protein
MIIFGYGISHGQYLIIGELGFSFVGQQLQFTKLGCRDIVLLTLYLSDTAEDVGKLS